MTDGTILVLNGTSSSGKTSIVRALQGLLEEPYLDIGIDRFLWMLPARYLNPPVIPRTVAAPLSVVSGALLWFDKV